jgi:hypothetical protein
MPIIYIQMNLVPHFQGQESLTHSMFRLDVLVYSCVCRQPLGRLDDTE